MNGFRRICAVIVGAVLFISGVLKLMDPTGTRLIVEEYFKFFRLGFLNFSAAPFGIILALFESVLGCALITGVWRKVSAIVSLCLLGVFTVITAVLWIFNPAMDCGCFGEALHLEHWQSFVKNLVLLGLWALAFLPLSKVWEPQRIKYVSFGIGALSVAFFALWSLLSIPLVDFTSLRPGTELIGAYDEDFDDIVAAVYEKNGREGAFAPESAPDSTWTFVRYENYDRGFVDDEAPGQVLSFCDASGEYADSLVTAGPVMVISAWDPAAIKPKKLAGMARMAEDAAAAGFTVLYLVSGTPESVQVNEPSLAAGTYFADRRTLMTLNRSNGGATFISDGNIAAKWAVRSLPQKEELGKVLAKDPVEFMMDRDRKGKVRLQGFLLYTFAVMLLL